MAREANVFVRDNGFNRELRGQLLEMVDAGSRRVAADDWASRPRFYKAAIWISYGIVRLAIGPPRLRRQRVVPQDRVGSVQGAGAAAARLLPKIVVSPSRSAATRLQCAAPPHFLLHRPLPAPAPALNGQPPPARGDWSTIRTLLPYLLAYRGRVAVAMSCPDRGEGGQCRCAADPQAGHRQPHPRLAGADAGAARGAASRLRRAAPGDDRLHRAARILFRQGHAARGAHHRA